MHSLICFCAEVNPSSLSPHSFPFIYHLLHVCLVVELYLILNIHPHPAVTHKLLPPSDVMCKTTAQADIVLLVDGSWSIGRLNFKTIRAFIARMVGVFEIGPERVQIGE